ncbi:TPA: hypothetical protein N3288_000213 [Klebsiella aerogenes]|nr:hypothetical protein [Klebsiella aerogenes]
MFPLTVSQKLDLLPLDQQKRIKSIASKFKSISPNIAISITMRSIEKHPEASDADIREMVQERIDWLQEEDE